jgi:uncharacterized protein YkwD
VARLLLIAAFLATASPVFAASLDRAVLDEINYARGHPAEYAQNLMDGRGDDSRYARANSGATEEAIDFLERQRPLPPLAPNQALAQTAAKLAAAQGPRGLTGHAGADGSSPGERIRRHGVSRAVAAEAISYCYGSAAGVVRQLIIDDGVSNRGHRMTIFDPDLRIAGAGCGPHAVYRYMCVIDFAGAPIGR